MYSLDNINLADYKILPSLAEGSNIALSGYLDMPKRLGKTHHVWHEEGVEPYVSANEIRFAGRNIVFNGLLNAGSKVNAIAKLDALYAQISSFTDLVWFTTPYGSFKVFIKEKIEVVYNHYGVATLKITFRQPSVTVPVNFVAPLFVTSEFIKTVCNPIIDDYENIKKTIFNNFVTTSFIAEGFIEQVLPKTNTYAHIDGIELSKLGLFVKKVADNFNRPVTQTDNVITDNLTEKYQIKTPAEKLLKLQLIAIASSVQELAQNTNALFVLFAKPQLRKIQIDTRILDAFSVSGFSVKNIQKHGNVCVAELEIELIII